MLLCLLDAVEGKGNLHLGNLVFHMHCDALRKSSTDNFRCFVSDYLEFQLNRYEHEKKSAMFYNSEKT